jgi:hypothetical protein
MYTEFCYELRLLGVLDYGGLYVVSKKTLLSNDALSLDLRFAVSQNPYPALPK